MFVRQSCDVQYLVLHIVNGFQCLICNACACNNCIMDNITQQCSANLVDRNNNLKPFATITCDSQCSYYAHYQKYISQDIDYYYT